MVRRSVKDLFFSVSIKQLELQQLYINYRQEAFQKLMSTTVFYKPGIFFSTTANEAKEEKIKNVAEEFKKSVEMFFQQAQNNIDYQLITLYEIAQEKKEDPVSKMQLINQFQRVRQAIRVGSEAKNLPFFDPEKININEIKERNSKRLDKEDRTKIEQSKKLFSQAALLQAWNTHLIDSDIPLEDAVKILIDFFSGIPSLASEKLRLDTSLKYFQQKNGKLIEKIIPEYTKRKNISQIPITDYDELDDQYYELKELSSHTERKSALKAYFSLKSIFLEVFKISINKSKSDWLELWQNKKKAIENGNVSQKIFNELLVNVVTKKLEAEFKYYPGSPQQEGLFWKIKSFSSDDAHCIKQHGVFVLVIQEEVNLAVEFFNNAHMIVKTDVLQKNNIRLNCIYHGLGKVEPTVEENMLKPWMRMREELETQQVILCGKLLALCHYKANIFDFKILDRIQDEYGVLKIRFEDLKTADDTAFLENKLALIVSLTKYLYFFKLGEYAVGTTSLDDIPPEKIDERFTHWKQSLTVKNIATVFFNQKSMKDKYMYMKPIVDSITNPVLFRKIIPENECKLVFKKILTDELINELNKIPPNENHMRLIQECKTWYEETFKVLKKYLTSVDDLKTYELYATSSPEEEKFELNVKNNAIVLYLNEQDSICNSCYLIRFAQMKRVTGLKIDLGDLKLQKETKLQKIELNQSNRNLCQNIIYDIIAFSVKLPSFSRQPSGNNLLLLGGPLRTPKQLKPKQSGDENKDKKETKELNSSSLPSDSAPSPPPSAQRLSTVKTQPVASHSSLREEATLSPPGPSRPSVVLQPTSKPSRVEKSVDEEKKKEELKSNALPSGSSSLPLPPLPPLPQRLSFASSSSLPREKSMPNTQLITPSSARRLSRSTQQPLPLHPSLRQQSTLPAPRQPRSSEMPQATPKKSMVKQSIDENKEKKELKSNSLPSDSALLPPPPQVPPPPSQKPSLASSSSLPRKKSMTNTNLISSPLARRLSRSTPQPLPSHSSLRQQSTLPVPPPPRSSVMPQAIPKKLMVEHSSDENKEKKALKSSSLTSASTSSPLPPPPQVPPPPSQKPSLASSSSLPRKRSMTNTNLIPSPSARRLSRSTLQPLPLHSSLKQQSTLPAPPPPRSSVMPQAIPKKLMVEHPIDENKEKKALKSSSLTSVSTSSPLPPPPQVPPPPSQKPSLASSSSLPRKTSMTSAKLITPPSARRLSRSTAQPLPSHPSVRQQSTPPLPQPPRPSVRPQNIVAPSDAQRRNSLSSSSQRSFFQPNKAIIKEDASERKEANKINPSLARTQTTLPPPRASGRNSLSDKEDSKKHKTAGQPAFSHKIFQQNRAAIEKSLNESKMTNKINPSSLRPQNSLVPSHPPQQQTTPARRSISYIFKPNNQLIKKGENEQEKANKGHLRRNSKFTPPSNPN